MTSTPSLKTCPVELASGTSRLSPTMEKHEVVLLLLLGFGGFSVMVAVIYNALRRYVFKDVHNLDTVFDAGGRVSLSLTAVTVTSQSLWPADFLHSSTLIRQSGIGGSLWYTIAIVVNILMFPMMSLKLKTRAPGAKTFPQIVNARFGKYPHIMICTVALVNNVIIITSILLAGKTALEVLAKDVSTEFIMLVLAVLFGSYCMIGGLGTTFYISYFNTALAFISVSVFIIKINYLATPEVAEVASKTAMYEALSCLKGPDGNHNNSLLTFRTRYGFFYGIVLLFLTISVGFCDQANWQSRIAAKPSQGVLGFLIAAYLWFALPTSISFTAAMSYMSMSFQNGTHLLDQAGINNGYITPYVMETMLGSTGGYLLMTMLMMALMSTGSGEVMSVSSIIVYDIYKTYIRPFRKNLLPTMCILCCEDKLKSECVCPSEKNCQDCINDKLEYATRNHSNGSSYTCTVHGTYRQYEDMLLQYKSWCMVWVVILLVPFGLVITEVGVNLTWAVYAGPVFLSSFPAPIFLTITWAKTTGKGVVAGGLSGLVTAVTAMFSVGSTYDGGLSDFCVNTSKEYSLIAGLVGGLVVSTIVCVVTSLCTTTVKSHDDELAEWAKTMSIDNPLNPYRAVYAEELDAINAGPIISSDTMARIFRRAQKLSYIGGGISVALFLVVIPAVALSFEVLTQKEFDTWLSVCQIWCFIGTVFVVVFPPLEEGILIYKEYRKNKQNISVKSTWDSTRLQDTSTVKIGILHETDTCI